MAIEVVETLYRLLGVEQATSGLKQIGVEAEKAAGKVEGLAGKRAGKEEGIGGFLKSQFGLSLTTVGGLALISNELNKQAQAWEEDEQAIFRASVVLRNMGSSLPLGELQSFAAQMQETIAIDDEAVVSLGGLLARFKLTGEQIKLAIPAIVDASKATGRSVEDIGSGLGRTLAGGRNGLRDLGIEFKSTGNRVQDFAALVKQLEDRFEGAGAAERKTATGSKEAFAQQLANARSEAGRGYEQNVGRPGREAATGALQAFNKNPNQWLEVLALANPILAPVIRLFQTRGPAGDPAADVGNGKTKEESLLGEIAANTAATKDAITSQILGGGALARGALNIRSLNAAVRSSF